MWWHFRPLHFKTFSLYHGGLLWCFSPFSTKALNIQDSRTNVAPKMGMNLKVIGLHFLHYPPFVKVYFTPKTHSWPHGLLNFTLSHEPNVKVMIMQLAQSIARPSFSVALCVGLFCKKVWCFENFTLCDLDNFDVIIKNTLLDAYKVKILYNKSKLRIYAKIGFKLVNLNVDYNSSLVEWELTLLFWLVN
jgi:hypothetical protein